MGNASLSTTGMTSSIGDVTSTTSTITEGASRPDTPACDEKFILQAFSQDKLNYVREIVKSMYNCRDADAENKIMNPSIKKSLKELQLFYSFHDTSKQRKLIGDELATANASKVFLDYMKLLTNDGDEFPTKGCNYECFEILLSNCWNYTDASEDLCKQFGEVGMLNFFIQYLQKSQYTFQSNRVQYNIALSSMAVTHNCVKLSGNMKYYKAMNAVDTVAWYAKSLKDSKDVLAITSILTLAYIADETNNHIIQTDRFVIQTILKFLAESLTASNHRFNGFSAEELTQGLTRLASNAENSVAIVKHGFLDSIITMMKGESTAERTAAVTAVWALAFEENNHKAINEEKKIMELLEIYSLSEDSLTLNVNAIGALWTLAHGMETMSTSSHDSEVTSTNDEQHEAVLEEQTRSPGHVMISYQWDCQDLMIKVKQELETNGYNVWMDLEEMSGSTLQSMATGVENAAVVLVCMSQKYKDSQNCRSEADYIYKRKTPFIPLRVEPGYEPDEWFGVFIGSRLYFDFSSMNFEQIMPKLIKELSDKGRQHEKMAEANPIQIDKVTKYWNVKDVEKWAQEKDINNLNTQFLNGNALLSLKKLKLEAPEFFYHYVTYQLGLKNIEDIMKFANATAELM